MPSIRPASLDCESNVSKSDLQHVIYKYSNYGYDLLEHDIMYQLPCPMHEWNNDSQMDSSHPNCAG